MQKIFDPNEKKRPMRVACFGSGSGTNIEAILEEEKKLKAERNPLFEVVAIFANKECRCLEIAKTNKIMPILEDYKSSKKECHQSKDTMKWKKGSFMIIIHYRFCKRLAKLILSASLATCFS
jgi:folate-dependent phosphoribosylglycinamide formyltransferase PurN